MADFLDILGQGLQNRFNQAVQPFSDPTSYLENRIAQDLGVSTATNRAAVGPTVEAGRGLQPENPLNQFAGAGRGFVNPPSVVPTQPTAVSPQGPAVPQDYNAQIAQAESGNNPNIGYHDQSKSSAYGPYGITAGAWADARKVDPSLPEDITKATREQMTQAQNDVTANNAKYLQHYGVEVNPNTLSAAHFLGAKGLSDYLKDGTISPQAAKANGGEENVRKIVQQRLGGKFAPASGGAVAPQATPAAPAAAPINPADMGEFAGLDQAIAQQAAQPQPSYTNEQLDAAMQAEQERQKHYDDLNGNDPKRLLALTENPDKAIAGAASEKLADIFKDKKIREYAQTTVDRDLAQGKIPDIKRLKGEEGSYIKAYLFARLGLNDLAQQEQEKISPTKQHLPVMIGDQHYAATYSKNGELLSARDESGKPVDQATFDKIAANAFATKGATTGQSFMKDSAGNIWSHTVTPGTNQVVWTNQTTGKAQTTAPTGLTPFGQVNPATRANINLATSVERMMMTQNNKDKAAGLAPTYTQEQIDAEKERITNGGIVKPEVAAAAAQIPAPQGAAPAAPTAAPAKKGEVEARGTPALEAQAQAIYSGEQEMPKGMGATNARNQWLSARVNEIAQQKGTPYDPTLFKNRQEIETAFTKGPEAKVVRSMNVAIDHLDTLNSAAKELKNGNIPLFNDIANKFAKNTGQPAPTNFDALKSIVGSEVAKAVAGGATALGDREEIRKEISSANSPAQLAGVIEKYQQLLAGQMKGLHQQYTSAGGNRWESKIEPRTQEVMDRIEKSRAPATATPAPYQDKSKEQRYQEWLKKHPEFQGTK